MTPPASFEKINYSIRPGKATQRRMLVEAVGRLAPLYPLHEYQYIGFGSTFFLDFKMIHRQYGLSQLVSIEKEQAKQRRFDFNKPYSCVRMFYGTAAQFLESQRMRWNRPTIMWLDYDYRLSHSVLADIDRVVEKVKPGSLLLVTVDADPPPGRRMRVELGAELEWDRLIEFVGGKLRSLGGGGLADAYHRYATDEINAKLRRARPECKWEQLFNFRYDDGSRMYTFGGLVVDSEVDRRVGNCRFDELDYYRPGNESFTIKVPNLTSAEVHRLAQSMPKPSKVKREALTKLAIDETDIDNYELLYRYLPQFVESHV